MIARRAIIAIVVALLPSLLLYAQTADSITMEEPFAQPESELPTPNHDQHLIEGIEPHDEPPLLEGFEPIEEPDWADSPYRTSGWRFGLPSISALDDDSGSRSLRAMLGYEAANGIGWRAEYWLFEDEDQVGGDRLEFLASTLFADYYKRYFFKDAELVLGGGFGTGYLDYSFSRFDETSRFYGGGGSVVAEGFLPFFCGKKTALGAVGQARVALLVGDWTEDDLAIGSLTDGWAMLIEEFGWGLELRRRFGENDSKYWYINLMRELQHWGSPELPYSSDLIFQGTALNFGIAW